MWNGQPCVKCLLLRQGGEIMKLRKQGFLNEGIVARQKYHMSTQHYYYCYVVYGKTGSPWYYKYCKYFKPCSILINNNCRSKLHLFLFFSCFLWLSFLTMALTSGVLCEGYAELIIFQKPKASSELKYVFQDL